MNIENIHVGDKVVITGWKGHTYDYERQEVYGAPAQVVGVCAPYLAIRPVGDDRIVRTVDTRIWCLTKCSDDYAKVFVQSVADVQPQAKMEVKFRGREILCPVCEEGRFVKVYASGKQPQWRCGVCESTIVEGGERNTQRNV